MAMIISAGEPPAGPPKAKTQPKVLEAHGDKRVDNYFWLREKESPEVRQYLEAENAWTEAQLKDTDGLQKKIYEEIVGRIQETDSSAPVRSSGYLYYTRTEKGKNYTIYCRKQGTSGAEETLLDGNVLAEGQKYFQVGIFDASPDQRLLAYGTDTDGSEELTVRFKDLKSGQLLPDQLDKLSYGFTWANDNKTVFYVVEDASRRPYRLYRHVLGTKQAADALIYEEKDERFRVGIGVTRSRQFLVLQLDSQTTTEIRVAAASNPDEPFRVVVPRTQDVEAGLTHHGSSFFIRINDTGRTFRLVEAPVDAPDKSNWRERIAARKEVTLEEVDAYGDHLVTVERDRGLRKIRVKQFSTGAEHFVEFPEASYSMYAGGGDDFQTQVLRFNYTSLSTPMTAFDYDMNTKQRTLVKQQAVLGGFDPARYQTERREATAADGTKVPVSIVYRKGTKMDGSNPALLYGYGSYGAPSDASFSSTVVSLLDRGFVYAIAHIRGGGDLGKTWHDDGRMLNKRNSFTDFIAAAELLVKDKYTQPKKLGILGGSAGGLLMGAVVNLRPDLFGAVIAKVPFVDVVSTMMDSTLPLTVGEYEEWGNPAEAKAYSYMRSYSPYDNVERQSFPNMLVTAGLNDPRVSYWEPAKWVAKLRTLKKDSNLLLLKTNMGAGHFGASGRYERFKENALDYAFLIKALGLRLE
jgi:oligopeptidase B